MNASDILKEAFKSDMDILERALDSDKELMTVVAGWTTTTITRIGVLLDILVSRNLITLDDAKKVFDVGNEIKLEDMFTVEEKEEVFNE